MAAKILGVPADIPRLAKLCASVRENRPSHPTRVTLAEYAWFIDNAAIHVWEDAYCISRPISTSSPSATTTAKTNGVGRIAARAIEQLVARQLLLRKLIDEARRCRWFGSNQAAVT